MKALLLAMVAAYTLERQGGEQGRMQRRARTARNAPAQSSASEARAPACAARAARGPPPPGNTSPAPRSSSRAPIATICAAVFHFPSEFTFTACVSHACQAPSSGIHYCRGFNAVPPTCSAPAPRSSSSSAPIAAICAAVFHFPSESLHCLRISVLAGLPHLFVSNKAHGPPHATQHAAEECGSSLTHSTTAAAANVVHSPLPQALLPQ